MKWMKERELLIAQTMAFVQSVAAKKATAEAREGLRQVLIEPTLIKSTPVGEIAEVKRPAETVRIETARINHPSPVRVSDIRQEIRGRVAAFRAHQELFHRERDEYYNSVVTRLRASTDHAPKAPDDHLPKR